MSDAGENRELDPGKKFGVYILIELEDSVHHYPGGGPYKHHTKDCWCNPEENVCPFSGRDVFIHKDHSTKQQWH